MMALIECITYLYPHPIAQVSIYLLSTFDSPRQREFKKTNPTMSQQYIINIYETTDMNANKISNQRDNKLEIIFEQNKIKQNQINAKCTKPMRSFFNESELIHTMNLTAKTR